MLYRQSECTVTGRRNWLSKISGSETFTRWLEHKNIKLPSRPVIVPRSFSSIKKYSKNDLVQGREGFSLPEVILGILFCAQNDIRQTKALAPCKCFKVILKLGGPLPVA